MGDDKKKTSGASTSLFGDSVERNEAQVNSEALRQHEILSARRRLIVRILLCLVAVGIVVVATLFINGAWHNAAAVAKAELDELIEQHETETRDIISYSYNGFKDARLKIQWLGRNQERANSILMEICNAAVAQKPSEVCIVTASKPLLQGLPEEEYEIFLSINGEDAVEIEMENGSKQVIELNNEIDPELFCAILNQYHARLYPDAAYSLAVAVPVHEETTAPKMELEVVSGGEDKSSPGKNLALPVLEFKERK